MQNASYSAEPVAGRVDKLSGTYYQRVSDQLRSDILDGVIRPGAKLKVLDLAKKYGLSQMPVREAIQQLQGEGLVEIIPNRGASVRTVDRQFVSDLFEIRAVMEAALARKVASTITQEQLDRLWALERTYEKERHDADARIVNNYAFHYAFHQMSGNEPAARLLAMHIKILHGLRRRFGFGQARVSSIIEEHRALIAAFENHDPEKAASITADHIVHALDDLVAFMPGDVAG